MNHILKIRAEYLDNILNGKKSFEIRYNDRDYQVGDNIQLNELDGIRSFVFKVTYIHTGLGMEKGYVVLGFKGVK